MSRRSAAAIGCTTLLGLAVMMLGGCPQVAALAPVGGDEIAEVRYGAIDVLLREEVSILEAPTCTAGEGTSVTCSGTTTDGGMIEVVSSTEPDAVLDVSVSGVRLFSGPHSEVLDEAARG